MSRPAKTRSSRSAKSFRARLFQAQALALGADREKLQAAGAAGFDHALRIFAVGGDDRRLAGFQQIPEQPQLGVEIVVETGVIIEMVAREIGEAGRRQAHAVEPSLVEAMRGGLHRQMGHAFARQSVKGLVQADRVRRRQRAVNGAARLDHADRAERGRRKTAEGENLPREIGDRGLARRSGDCDDAFRLAGKQRRRRQRQAFPRIRDLDERRAGQSRRRGLFADHRHGPRGQGLGGELHAVGLAAGEREKQRAGRDRAAVGRHAGRVEAAPFLRRFGQQGVETHQWSPGPVIGGALAKP